LNQKGILPFFEKEKFFWEIWMELFSEAEYFIPNLFNEYKAIEMIIVRFFHFLRTFDPWIRLIADIPFFLDHLRTDDHQNHFASHCPSSTSCGLARPCNPDQNDHPTAILPFPS
jgi:hypothetical protein